jgi:hypothetical protein
MDNHTVRGRVNHRAAFNTRNPVKTQIDKLATEERWGRVVSARTFPGGRVGLLYRSATHETVVSYGPGGESLVHRKPLVATPEGLHARQSALIAKAGYGKRIALLRHRDDGRDFHHYEDATHRTIIVHLGGEVVTHRKPKTP